MRITVRVYDYNTGEILEDTEIPLPEEEPKVFPVENFDNFVVKFQGEYKSFEIESVIILEDSVEIWLPLKYEPKF